MVKRLADALAFWVVVADPFPVMDWTFMALVTVALFIIADKRAPEVASHEVVPGSAIALFVGPV